MKQQSKKNNDVARVRRVLEQLRMDNIRRHNAARAAVRQAYGGRPKCVYCGGGAGTADHVLARALGGGHLITNLVPACRKCNGSKGMMTPAQFFEGHPKAAARFVQYAIHADPELRAIAARYVPELTAPVK